jgi:hypothetical protein
MPKTEITRKIEKALFKRYQKTSCRFATEVPMSNGLTCEHNEFGIVDFVAINIKDKEHKIPYIYSYEIKVSLSDFKSLNGHTFLGDENYYVMPEALYKKMKEKEEYPKQYYSVGIIVFTKKGHLRIVKEAHKAPRLNFESKMEVVDSVIMRWTTGSMFSEIEKSGIELRNFLIKDK